MNSIGHALYFEHSETDCPLLQETPDQALDLADRIESRRPTGAFYPKRHRGVAIGEGNRIEALAQAYEELLPKHRIEIRETHLGPFARFMAEPSLLDDPDEQVSFFRLVAAGLFPARDLTPSDDERGLTKSLAQLPGYLRKSAPGR